MPQYFFNVANQETVTIDDRGVKLKDLSDAHEHGVKLQRQLKQYDPERFMNCVIKIADENGNISLIILPQSNVTAWSFIGSRGGNR